MAKRDFKHGACSVEHNVAVHSGGGKHVLSVFRKLGGKMVPADLDGAEFSSADAARERAIEHGYLRPYLPRREQRQARLERIRLFRLVHVKPTGAHAPFAVPSSSAGIYGDARYFCGGKEVNLD